MPSNGTVYGLVDSETLELRYIGITIKTPEERLKEHLRNTYEHDGSYHVHRWIRQSTYRPSIVILERNPVDLFEAERLWIADLRSQGARLTNMTDGGDGTIGYVFDEEVKAKMSASANARWSRPGERERLSAFQTGKKLSQEHRAAISASMKGNTNTLGYRKELVAHQEEIPCL